MEFVREALGPETSLLIKRVVALQDHLGLMNDADVAVAAARGFLVQRASRLSEEESSAIGRYLLSREREVTRLKGTVGHALEGRGEPGLPTRARTVARDAVAEGAGLGLPPAVGKPGQLITPGCTRVRHGEDRSLPEPGIRHDQLVQPVPVEERLEDRDPGREHPRSLETRSVARRRLLGRLRSEDGHRLLEPLAGEHPILERRGDDADHVRRRAADRHEQFRATARRRADAVAGLPTEALDLRGRRWVVADDQRGQSSRSEPYAAGDRPVVRPDDHDLTAAATDVDDRHVGLDSQAAGDTEEREQRLLLVVDHVELGPGRGLDLDRQPGRVDRAPERLGADDRDCIGVEVARLADVAPHRLDRVRPVRPEVTVLVDDRAEAAQHGLVDERPQLVIVDNRAEEMDGVRADVDGRGDAKRREMLERLVDRRGDVNSWSVDGIVGASSVLWVPAPRRVPRGPSRA